MPLSDKTEKPKDIKYVLKRLWGYLMEYKLWLLAALLLTGAGNIFSLIGPSLSGAAVDAIRPGGGTDFRAVGKYVILMIILYILSSVFSYLLSVLMIHIGRKITFAMRRDAFNALASLPVSYFDRSYAGNIISKLSYDIDTVNTSLSSDLVQIFASAITIVGAFVMMINISPILVTIFIVTIPLSVMVTSYIAKKVHPLFKKRSAALGELNGYAEEMITGQKTIRAYSSEAEIIRRFDEKNEEACRCFYNAEYYGSMSGPSMNFVNNLSLSLVSIFGAVMYLFGNISIGKISSFVLYSRKFAGPINEFANIINELQSSCAAAERVFRLIDEESEAARDRVSESAEINHTDVRVKNVRFSYVKGRPVIHDLSLSVKEGALIAITGPTGAGKTTLINLLMRFYDPDSGSIEIDGVNINSISRDELRKLYAMVLQETWLFNGTVFENIAYARPGASMDEVVQAAKAARIHEFIERLPDGYNTVLSENGINISKGQKQLLTIARAMLHNARMLILDEATSNVDTRTEKQISTAMRELMKDKTCFVIAHRLSTIQNADVILVVNDGDIIEMGTHDELMSRQGTYFNMYMSQYK
ncbi:MAG: ABC transporter ATP-binding protein [Oscillospiraceae bacterium]|nr:ABC transporter ATP-binding protein [Oscillospiraceae bacterium]